MSQLNTVICAFFLCVVMLASGFAQSPDSENTRKVISRVTPPYPEMARTMNVKGVVRLEIVVGTNGAPKTIKVIGGHPVLVQAAERAVQKWKWEPAGHESSEAIELRFNPE